MSLLIDLLHLVLAGALSLIGISYERAPECAPVQVEPAAYYQFIDQPVDAERVWFDAPPAPPALNATSDCGAVALPRVRLRA